MENNELEQEEIVQIENPSAPEEVLDTRSPLEIEAELLKQQEKEALEAVAKLPPDVIAAQYFRMLFPLYRDKVHGLNAKQAKRVLHSLVLYPLENDAARLESKVEQEAFTLGSRLLDAKFIIVQSAEINKQIQVDDKAKEAADEILKHVESNFQQGEEVSEQN
jgi:hypothetical protein